MLSNRPDAGLTIFFMIVVVVLALSLIRTALTALKGDRPTAKETPYQAAPADAQTITAQAKHMH